MDYVKLQIHIVLQNSYIDVGTYEMLHVSCFVISDIQLSHIKLSITINDKFSKPALIHCL